MPVDILFMTAPPLESQEGLKRYLRTGSLPLAYTDFLESQEGLKLQPQNRILNFLHERLARISRRVEKLLHSTNRNLSKETRISRGVEITSWVGPNPRRPTWGWNLSWNCQRSETALNTALCFAAGAKSAWAASPALVERDAPVILAWRRSA